MHCKSCRSALFYSASGKTMVIHTPDCPERLEREAAQQAWRQRREALSALNLPRVDGPPAEQFQEIVPV